MNKEPQLSTDSAERKRTPIYSGVIAYFPLAIAAVARVSQRGNDKHNPGQPLHHDRSKSSDHKDCIARHLVDIDTYTLNYKISPDGESVEWYFCKDAAGEFEDAACLAWRALAYLQELEEKRLGKGFPPGAWVETRRVHAVSEEAVDVDLGGLVMTAKEAAAAAARWATPREGSRIAGAVPVYVPEQEHCPNCDR